MARMSSIVIFVIASDWGAGGKEPLYAISSMPIDAISRLVGGAAVGPTGTIAADFHGGLSR
eukprot:3724561-Heterocapsa_arctica.AAC.1